MDEIFIEEKINFEDGWPWWFKLTDEDYPGAYQWKLNRGYTSSVGTGPKADRTTQSVCEYLICLRFSIFYFIIKMVLMRILIHLRP